MAAFTAVEKTRWMIYGANGYTGSLAAKLPLPEGLNGPILAGRSESKIKPLAESLNFEYRIFGLDDPQTIDNMLQDVFAVVVAAGPFIYTSKPFVDACLRTRTHYLDITGEYQVFEEIFSRNQEAVDAGVVLLPGVGMDVVPTDCLASRLKAVLPSATHLQLALMPVNGSISAGTMKTVLMGMSQTTQVRRNGQLTDSAAPSTLVQWNNPSLGTVQTMPLTWGDISTAFRTTAIPNIAVYLLTAGPLPTGVLANTVRWLASTGPIRWGLNRLIEYFVTGPTSEQNLNSRVHFSGIAWDANTHQVVECSLTTLEGYQLTALSMIASVNKLRTSHKQISGALTPSVAFGSDYVLEFEHSAWTDVVKRTSNEEELKQRVF